MEIGALAEWVAGVAELLAVSVALFLPYYTANKTKKHQQRNLRLVLQKLVGGYFSQEPDSIKTLDIFLKVSFLGNTDPANDELFLVGNEVLSLLKSPSVGPDTKRQRADQLLAQLDLTVTD